MSGQVLAKRPDADKPLQAHQDLWIATATAPETAQVTLDIRRAQALRVEAMRRPAHKQQRRRCRHLPGRPHPKLNLRASQLYTLATPNSDALVCHHVLDQLHGKRNSAPILTVPIRAA
jgi:hypothetical protein